MVNSGRFWKTGMSFQKEVEMVSIARKMDLFSIVYVATASEAVAMAEAGADAIIVHVGTTVGGSIGVREAVVSWEDTIERCQTIVRAVKETRKEVIPLAHGGPINTPEDVERIVQHTDVLGFVGASSLSVWPSNLLFPPHANLQGHPCSPRRSALASLMRGPLKQPRRIA